MSEGSGGVGKALEWAVLGVLSCTFAHAVMIPTGIEQWLHSILAAPVAPDVSAGITEIMDLSQ